jgi:hypothetical protein
MVALWLVGIEAAAVALKFALVVPAATMTDAGAASMVLLLASMTLEPPVGAVWFSVTMHVETPLWLRLVGVQLKPETVIPDRRLIEAVLEVAPRVVVTVAVWLLATVAAAVALKVAVVPPAATVTDAGTVSSVLLLASFTADPPVGAARVSVTVQELAALGFRDVGEQVTDETDGALIVPPAAVRVMPFAAGSVAIALDIWIDAEVIPGARVALRLATTPDAMAVAFIPAIRHVAVPAPDVQ